MALIKIEKGFQLAEFHCQHLRLENRDKRALSLTAFKTGQLRGINPLWKRKHRTDDGIHLGADAFKACWLNRDKLPAWLCHHHQLYFDGDVLMNEFGNELVLYLRWTKLDWNKDVSPMDWRWGVCATTYDWYRDFFSLVY